MSVIAKSPVLIVGCFPANAVSNPLVLAIVKSPSLIVGCLPDSAVSNPAVSVIAKSPVLIVGCFVPNSVIIFVEPITKSVVKVKLLAVKSVVLSMSSCLFAYVVVNPFVSVIAKLFVVIVGCFPSIAFSTFPILGMAKEV